MKKVFANDKIARLDSSGTPWPVMWKKPEFVQAAWICAATTFRFAKEDENEGAMLISGTVKALLGFAPKPLVSRESRYACAACRASFCVDERSTAAVAMFEIKTLSNIALRAWSVFLEKVNMWNCAFKR